jgi:thiol-disulfide isomerase/thioredoxin
MNSTTQPKAPAAPPSAQRLGNQARGMVAVLAVFSLGVVFWPHGETSFREPGGFLLDAGGRPATLGTRLEPVTLVHFWATWCPPCIQENPALQRLAHDLADHRDFSIVMVAVADSRSKVSSFMGPAAQAVLFDPKWEVAHRYGTEKLPESYLVVRGEVVEKFIGPVDWDSAEVRQKLLARVSPTPAVRGMAGS